MCYGYVCDYGEHFQQACLGRDSSFMSPCVYENGIIITKQSLCVGTYTSIVPEEKKLL